LYFSRDYTPHDHRFLTALAQAEQEVFYLRMERRANISENRPLPQQVEQINWVGGRDQARLRDGYRFLRNLKGIVRRLNPDVIQAGPIQTAAFLTALSGFKRLVSVSWGFDLLNDVHRGRLWRWATRLTLHRSAALVADCEIVRQQAVYFGMEPSRIVVFPWGVDLDQFSPNAEKVYSGDSQQPFTVLSTRSWETLYGVDILAHAFVEAAQELPQLRLIMTGNGSLAGKIRHIFLQAGVSDRVSLPGQVSQADLPRYYRSADLYVSASHIDGSSVSLLEALASGCPVLVSDIPGNLEWVNSGVQGWLFPDGDSHALAQAIKYAVHHRSELFRLGQAARVLAEARADWKKNFLKLFQAYEMAMS
jgi:glycosyltransferase involved in cell wall biosynthesis